jgi:hypothetical protein
MSNVNFLTGVFHPQYTFDTTNGVQMRLDTSLDGNVTMGDSSTNYSLTIDGIYITGSSGTLQISSDVYLDGGLISSNIAIPSGNIVLASGNIAAVGNLLIEGVSRFGGNVNIGDPSTNYDLNLNGVSVVKPRGSANLNTLTYAQIGTTPLYSANISMSGVLTTSQIQASLAVNPAPISATDATGAAASRIVCTVPRVNSADIVFGANPLTLGLNNVFVQWNVVSF